MLKSSGKNLKNLFYQLYQEVNCDVYIPGKKGYAEEILSFNRAFTHSPDIVVAAKSSEDIMASVRLAGKYKLPINCQTTGHGAVESIKSGIMISTRHLNKVSINQDTGIATVGGGANWQEVVTVATEHGLAPICGSSVTVGVAGYMLGGGAGPLARSHGFSSDYLLGATVVTGKGELVEATAETNSDLFWALQGGKHGLGIVTEMRIRLVKLEKVYGGSLFFEGGHIETAIREWVNWTKVADPMVTTSIAIVQFPSFEAVPAVFRGRTLLSMRFAYPGSMEEGKKLADVLRSFAPVYLDGVGELPTSQIARIHNDPTHPGSTWTGGMLLRSIDQDFATILLSQLSIGSSSPFIATEVRHIGEATHRDVEQGSAVAGRSAEFAFGFVGKFPDKFEPLYASKEAEILDMVRPWIAEENNINLMGKPRSPEHYASIWPELINARLNYIRGNYDPDGVFKHTFPVLESSDGAAIAPPLKKQKTSRFSSEDSVQGLLSYPGTVFANSDSASPPEDAAMLSDSSSISTTLKN